MRNFKQIFITWLMVLMAMPLTAQEIDFVNNEANRIVLEALKPYIVEQ